MEESSHLSALNRLITQLSRLPGVGKRSAQRLAFHLLKQPADEVAQLAAAIADLKHGVRHCSVCFNLTETDPCPICRDLKRDRGLLLVVEQPNDVAIFESTGTFRGVYHILMGRLSPLDGVGPGELNVDTLVERVKAASQTHPAESPDQSPPTDVREVILGLCPTLEGDGTALYLADQLNQLGVKVTRLARGLPTGSSLDFVSKAVLVDSIQGRQAMPVD